MGSTFHRTRQRGAGNRTRRVRPSDLGSRPLQTTCQGIGRKSKSWIAEAAGIEPLLPLNSNPMMAHDFGFCCEKTFGLRHRFFAPGVPSNPVDLFSYNPHCYFQSEGSRRGKRGTK
jgi:hypothetical protein